MGAAIGAKIANPNRPVILVSGDGSFHMNMNEMATAVSEKLPIVVLIFNNRVLGMVRQWQTLFYEHRYSQTSIDRATDYVKLAEHSAEKDCALRHAMIYFLSCRKHWQAMFLARRLLDR